jgi:hypothetical protein
MSWLENGQEAMMRALDHGPAHLPMDLFAGSVERVLAGMKVHANTISHARLVALEDTYPRTRDHLGHARFNQHSRLFLQQPGVAGRSLAMIGAGFDRFLARHGDGEGPAALARFEWLWLQSYHAAEADVLTLEELTCLASEALLEQSLASHPAAFAARFHPLVHDLIGAEVPGLASAEAILIARPEAEVLVSPATAIMADVLFAAEKSCTIGNLLERFTELGGDGTRTVDGIMQALVSLINAGALIRAKATGEVT